jgi:hypothetical protein
MCKKNVGSHVSNVIKHSIYFFIQPNTLSLYKVYVRVWLEDEVGHDSLIYIFGTRPFPTACFDDLVE